MERETKLLFGGMVVAALGFFIPLYFGKIWLGLFIALITGVIFLGRILSLSEKEFESKWAYRSTYGLVVLVVLFHAIAFAHDYGRKDYQKDLLLEIRKTIDSGATQADVREKLIYVLGEYHQNDRESIVTTFKDLMNEQIGEDGIYLSDFDLRKAAGDSSMADIDEDNLNHFYEIDEEADEVRVIVVADVSIGSDPDYENYDGQVGRYEMNFTLNEEGVSYEVLN
ncbi:hypothetical protein [Gracilimonas amylolytica]|uniref:hypothetical protein n=1 Tax=Gracilimonas amylolytica TaxID=1749045 RepID=UPI000CD8B46B|nr:hypothetical protein [Gracilimonas amylolytica]